MSSLFRNSTLKTVFHPFLGTPNIGTVCNGAGRSDVVDPAEWPKIGLLNQGFGSIVSIFPRKKSRRQSSLIFFSPDPGNLLNLIFGIGPDPVSSNNTL